MEPGSTQVFPAQDDMTQRPEKLMIGWRETVVLPELSVGPFSAKIDTGARTTALHATDINCSVTDLGVQVSFTPDHSALEEPRRITLPVHHMRDITNTSGTPEMRVIITTMLRLGPRSHPVEISLSDRSDMVFPMIVGRTALRLLRLTVDPARSWLQSPKPKG